MRVPETPWFNQILLYWDDAFSIVPAQLREDKLSQLGRYMTELYDAGLLGFVDPDPILTANSVDLNDQFMDLLDTYEPPVDTSAWRWTRLHAAKGTDVIFMNLVERGLVHRKYVRRTLGNRSYTVADDWFMVERGIGDLYVAFLAGSTCRFFEGIYPVTDSDYALTNFMSASDGTSRFAQEWRYAAITKALPVPSRIIPPAELASFKEKHRDKLRRLRLHLNSHLAELATIHDADSRAARTASILDDIKDDVAVLHEQMQSRRWPRIALAGVGGIVASGLGLGAIIASGGNALALGLGIAAGVAAFGPAAYGAADTIRSGRFDSNSPLAYAVLAEAL
jgi:hypothetical protein